jgi:hypothetical protein
MFWCETSSSSAHEVQHHRSKMLVTPEIFRESAVLLILDLAISTAVIPFVSVHPSSPALLLFCLVGFPGGRLGGGGGAMAAVLKRSAFHGGSRRARIAANQPVGVVSLQVRISYSKSEEAFKLSAKKRKTEWLVARFEQGRRLLKLDSACIPTVGGIAEIKAK